MNLDLLFRLLKNEESCRKKIYEVEKTDLELWIVCLSSLNLICCDIARMCPRAEQFSSDRCSRASGKEKIFFKFPLELR